MKIKKKICRNFSLGFELSEFVLPWESSPCKCAARSEKRPPKETSIDLRNVEICMTKQRFFYSTCQKISISAFTLAFLANSVSFALQDHFHISNF